MRKVKELFVGKRKVDEVIMHCAATPDAGPENQRWFNLDIKEIDRWHKQRGWRGVGYHYFIKRDGTLQKGRAEGTSGAHTRGKNHQIGVCYAGTKRPTDAQKATMRMLAQDIRDRLGISPLDWRCHYEFANKACPGFTREKLHEILLGD